jgi:murein DD-endopeptidase MepM/ murein hydrolase activator NlpD
VAFSVSSSAPVQSCNLTASTPNGVTSIPVTVGRSFADVQHTYSRNPLSLACRITSWFDAVRNAVPHRALDVVLDQGETPLGTEVTAMEGGQVTQAVQNQGPAASPFPACQGAPANNVQVRGPDGYVTVYYHVKPVAGVAEGQPVSAGQVIGHLDNSGCQTRPHLHVRRRAPNNGPPVNFRIPCVNADDHFNYVDGNVEDISPDDH